MHGVTFLEGVALATFAVAGWGALHVVGAVGWGLLPDDLDRTVLADHVQGMTRVADAPDCALTATVVPRIAVPACVSPLKVCCDIGEGALAAEVVIDASAVGVLANPPRLAAC